MKIENSKIYTAIIFILPIILLLSLIELKASGESHGHLAPDNMLEDNSKYIGHTEGFAGKEETGKIEYKNTHESEPTYQVEADHAEIYHHSSETQPEEHEISHHENLSTKEPDHTFDMDHEVMHETDETHEELQTEQIPITYFIHWGILILVMVNILIYFVIRFKKGQKKTFIPLAIFFVILILAAYLIENTSTFTRRFDLGGFRFVQDFHEGTKLGFLRFIYKFLLGIFLIFFAFLNMNTKNFYINGKDVESKSKKRSK